MNNEDLEKQVMELIEKLNRDLKYICSLYADIVALKVEIKELKEEKRLMVILVKKFIGGELCT